jgi:TetR/AcrR family transcriptional regulator, transcriptional repressor for nem operon
MRSHHGYTAPGDDAFLHSNWSSEPKSGRAKRTSKEKLIRAARNLMLAQGYPITSVDDIIEAAGVSKGSFYHYFDSKEELALTAMHEFLADGASLMMDGPFRDIADPRDRSIAFLKHVESVAMRLWDHGCLLVMFSVELAGTSPGSVKRQAPSSLI